MSHGVHNHGHHLKTHGAHSMHGNHGAAAANTPAAQHAQQPAGAAGSTPAAQAQQAQHPMDGALAALDQAINNLKANFHKDSFNGQQAPTGVQAAPSTLTNSVGDPSKDLFLNTTGAAAAPAPAAAPATTTTALNDPILNLRGGGGASGGVLGDRTFLNSAGGGAASGGVL